MMAKFYAGIGSRETPPDIYLQMQTLASMAATSGWTLRSGAAHGADTAFEKGCDAMNGPKEIMLPWKGFNGSVCRPTKHSDAAMKVAEEIHPAWGYLKPAAKQLVSRNMQQIMGENMDSPIKLVICWTKDGCESIETYNRKTGGTGTAIAFASSLNIPVFNLKNNFRYDYALEALHNL